MLHTEKLFRTLAHISSDELTQFSKVKVQSRAVKPNLSPLSRSVTDLAACKDARPRAGKSRDVSLARSEATASNLTRATSYFQMSQIPILRLLHPALSHVSF